MDRAAEARSAQGVFAAVVAVTIASQFFRASTGVLGPELIRDLALTPEALGLANAAFFIAITVMQIPVGMLFDRFGPRRVVAALSLFTVLGALLQAAAQTENAFVMARLLVGIGSAASFMAAVVLCARWFGGPSFGTTLSRVFALSGIGYLLAGSPWAAFASWLGWRSAFAASALAAAFIGWFFFAVVRDRPGNSQAARTSGFAEIVAGYREVWRTPGLAPILAMHFVAYAAFITVFGVWAGPYLNDVYGLRPIARGNALLAMALAQIAATLAYGPLGRWFARRTIVVAGAILSIAPLAIVVAFPLSADAAILALVLFCAISSFSVVNVADANSRFAASIAGRGATAVNLFQVVGTSALPILSGAVIGLFPEGNDGSRPEAAYRAAFGAIAACLALGLVLYALLYKRPEMPNRTANNE